MPRRVLLLVLACALLAPPAAGAAEVTRKKAIWGPVAIDGVSQFPRYADLGVGIFQLAVRWDQVAPRRPQRPWDPDDPAYAWPPEVDAAVAEAREHGIRVAVMLLGAPGWANGGREWFWAPERPRDFARFAAAASRRWPAVRHWLIWGEPSKAQNFQPLESDGGKPLRGRRATRGPRRYARILDASYRSLHGVARRNKVIGGNTFTVGDVRPLHYIRALELPGGRPPRMDLYGHNPFSLRRPDLDAPPLRRGYADFSDLDELTRVLDRHVRQDGRRRGKRLKVFISEYSLPTSHPNHEFNFHVTEEVQAEWLTAALRITRAWKRLYTFGYLGLYDDPERPDGFQVERGLLRRDGSPKPGYFAFRSG